MTKVLVGYATKHSSTAEIAQALAAAIGHLGFDVEVRSVARVDHPEYYDAFVLGSAVYAGHLILEWENFIQSNVSLLRSRPVWLFSTGPIGDPPFPKDETPRMAEVAELIGAREHCVFGGKVDPNDLNLVERLLSHVVRAKPGDYRDWEHVIEWANHIGAGLLAQTGAKHAM